MFGCLAASYVPDRIDKRVVLILSCFGLFITQLFVGPSTLFGFKDSLGLMIIGQVLIGLVLPFVLVPTLPEMSDSVLPHYPVSE